MTDGPITSIICPLGHHMNYDKKCPNPIDPHSYSQTLYLSEASALAVQWTDGVPPCIACVIQDNLKACLGVFFPLRPRCVLFFSPLSKQAWQPANLFILFPPHAFMTEVSCSHPLLSLTATPYVIPSQARFHSPQEGPCTQSWNIVRPQFCIPQDVVLFHLSCLVLDTHFDVLICN